MADTPGFMATDACVGGRLGLVGRGPGVVWLLSVDRAGGMDKPQTAVLAPCL